MSEKRYYEFLSKIPNSNEAGKYVMVDKIPFNEARDGIQFVMKHFPEMEPNDTPVKSDPARVKELANTLVYEVMYLRICLEEMYDEMRAKTEEMEKTVHKLEEGHRDLRQQCEYELAQEHLREMGHECIGILGAIQRVRSREFELWTLTGRGIPVEWRL